MKAQTTILVAAMALFVSPAAFATRELLDSSGSTTWRSALSGGEEVAGPVGTGPFTPAPTQTGATGECKLTIPKSEDSVTYTCVVRGPLASGTKAVGVPDSPPKERAITLGHIHLGKRQTNGPVAVFLLGKNPTVKISNDKLPYTFSGSFKQANLEPNFKLIDVIKAIKTEGAYVNVHTIIYPAGELRGQIVRSS